jgi:hypothetical protein
MQSTAVHRHRLRYQPGRRAKIAHSPELKGQTNATMPFVFGL